MDKNCCVSWEQHFCCSIPLPHPRVRVPLTRNRTISGAGSGRNELLPHQTKPSSNLRPAILGSANQPNHPDKMLASGHIPITTYRDLAHNCKDWLLAGSGFNAIPLVSAADNILLALGNSLSSTIKSVIITPSEVWCTAGLALDEIEKPIALVEFTSVAYLANLAAASCCREIASVGSP